MSTYGKNHYNILIDTRIEMKGLSRIQTANSTTSSNPQNVSHHTNTHLSQWGIPNKLYGLDQCRAPWLTLDLSHAGRHWSPDQFCAGLQLRHCTTVMQDVTLAENWVQDTWDLLEHFSPNSCSDPVDCSPPGSSIHGILQARILEWVAIALSNLLIP